MCSQFLLNYFHLFWKWYKMARFCEKYYVWYLPSNDLKIATKRNLKGQSVHLEFFVCINFGFFTEHLENAKIEWAAQPFIVNMTLKKKQTNICNESSRPDNLCSVQLVPEFRFTLFPKSSEGLLSSCTKYLKECKTDKISFSIFLIWKIKELNLGEGSHFARILNSNFLKGSTHSAMIWWQIIRFQYEKKTNSWQTRFLSESGQFSWLSRVLFSECRKFKLRVNIVAWV